MTKKIPTFFLILFLFPLLVFTDEQYEDRVILSTPEEIVALSLDTDELIGGVMSPLSGQLSLRAKDLVVKGAQPLAISRKYIPPSMPKSFVGARKRQNEWENYSFARHLLSTYKGWVTLPHLRLEYFNLKNIVRVTYPNGMTLDFRLAEKEDQRSELLSENFALTNLSGGSPSGQNDMRNTHVMIKDGTIHVRSPNGTLRLYEQIAPSRFGRLIFNLVKEKLPNGKTLLYEYQGRQLKSIQSKDPHERSIYASIDFEKKMFNGMPSQMNMKTSTGISSQYIFGLSTLEVSLEKNPFSGAKMRTKWSSVLPPLLKEISSPFYRNERIQYDSRYLLKEYRGQQHVFACEYRDVGGINRIHELSLPLGPEEEFEPIYRMRYDIPQAGEKSGSTLVSFPDGTAIRYRYSKKLLLKSIQYLDERQELYKEKVFNWDAKQWLKTIKIQGHAGNLLSHKSYEYDEFGNPILEINHGDLTGRGLDESTYIRREYSQDGMNLLLKETEEEGKTTHFEYLPGTNLPTKKLIGDRERILLREFYIYDDAKNLIQAIFDDGSGTDLEDLEQVTQRTSRKITLRQKQPFLHMPEMLEEIYFENGQEKLLKRTLYRYDAWGNVQEEEVYGSDGIFSHTLTKEYNERGDLLSETNPLGDEATYGYDDRGLLVFEKNFSQKRLTKYKYDANGRLRKKTEKGRDEKHITTYERDFRDRIRAKRDYLGNLTAYAYEPFLKDPSIVTFPSIRDSNDSQQLVQIQYTYNPLGYCLEKRDARGLSTKTTYNFYGLPIKILHPDGATESFSYYKSGYLASHTDSEGHTVKYDRDVFGHATQKTYLDAAEQPIAKEVWMYKGENLLTSTNREGKTTSYTYDGAGRKISEEFCERKQLFSYDSLGYLSQITCENHCNPLIISYYRDRLGQILEEEKKDSSGEVLYKIGYGYDKDGNRVNCTRWIQNYESVDKWEYDAFGRPILHIDPLDFRTKTLYREDHLNSLGQKVLKVVVIDPMGRKRLTIHDPFDRVVESERLNSNGDTIEKHKLTYDPSGNMVLREDHVYEGTSYLETQGIENTYDARDRLVCMTQGSKTTHYTYSPSGRLKTKTPPNQITLIYDYDALGYLSSVQSQDKVIDHRFSHNKLGHLLSATDQREDLTVERKVDPFGNTLKETFPAGFQIEKSYDAFDRPLSLKLDRHGVVDYCYDPLYLREIKRDASQFSYTHRFHQYDLSGRRTEIHPIHELKPIYYHYDSKGRLEKLHSPYLSERASYDPCDNLMAKSGQTYIYDDLDQLIVESDARQTHDSIYNLRILNDERAQIDTDNQLNSIGSLSCEYDENGNLALKGDLLMKYDPLNRLIRVSSEAADHIYTYDPLGRRLSKTSMIPSIFGSHEETEYYIHDGDEEIGSFNEEGNLTALKVQESGSMSNPIAIELEGQVFAPILDMHGHVRKLLASNQQIYASSDYGAFGEEKVLHKSDNPWGYHGKRKDFETGFLNFGKRYYDPSLHRWLTVDPAGHTDSVNLYQYVLNNPFKYSDSNGESLLGYIGGLVQMAAGGVVMISGVALEIGTAGGYSFAIGIHEAAGLALITTGFAQAMHHSQDLSLPLKPVFNERDYYSQVKHNNLDLWRNAEEESTYKESQGGKKKPPFSGDDLIADPSKPPAPGFEWRGKGKPGSNKGSWVRGHGSEREVVHPDLGHGEPIGPHWDYTGPDFPEQIRIFPKGGWEYK